MSNRVLMERLREIVGPWHNYKRVMSHDSELRVRPDGTVVPVINVGKFQDIINNCSGELMNALDLSDPEFLTSLMEVVGNAKAIVDMEAARNTRAVTVYGPKGTS